MATKKNASKKNTGRSNLPAQRGSTNVQAKSDLPDYMKGGTGRGSEDVEMQDMIIPRIEIVQALSPVLKRNDPEYIENADQGDLFNTVSRAVYEQPLKLVPVMYRREFLLWKDRKAGGGFRGSFPTMEEAQAAYKDLMANNDGPAEIVETAQHIVLVLHEDGSHEEAVLSMSRSKMKVNRGWNSLIRMKGGDRFSHVYELTVVMENGQKGEYFNYSIHAADEFTPPEAYQAAERLYESMQSGDRRFTVDNSDGSGRKESNEY